ncbi:MAG: helix-turn-helix transcriptional regulator [Cyanobacteria bacterium P01_G01_bin.54]
MVDDLYSDRLRSRLAALAIPSFRALARQADVSDWAVRQLRRGQAQQLRGQVLVKLAAALDCSLPELLQQFSADLASLDGIEEEAKDHQGATSNAVDGDVQIWQREALDTLESWLRQWPTAAAAIAKNPDLPAARLLPLLQPLTDLLAQWDVEAIAPVGEIVAYEPQWHQLLEGTAEPGDRVRVRYGGYRHQGKLLFRAQVSPTTDYRSA